MLEAILAYPVSQRNSLCSAPVPERVRCQIKRFYDQNATGNTESSSSLSSESPWHDSGLDRRGAGSRSRCSHSCRNDGLSERDHLLVPKMAAKLFNRPTIDFYCQASDSGMTFSILARSSLSTLACAISIVFPFAFGEERPMRMAKSQIDRHSLGSVARRGRKRRRRARRLDRSAKRFGFQTVKGRSRVY